MASGDPLKAWRSGSVCLDRFLRFVSGLLPLITPLRAALFY